MSNTSTTIEDVADSRLEAALRRLTRPLRASQPLRQAVSPPLTRGEIESPVTRARCLRRIRYLMATYMLDWIVAQWVELLGPLKGMENTELLAVLADLDNAYDCLREGIPLEDVFLAPVTVEQTI